MLKEKVEPFFNYITFKAEDSLKNSLFTYALIYKNILLLSHITENIDLEDLEPEY